MMQALTVGKRVAEARAAMTPPLSRCGLARRLKEQGLDIDRNGVAAIENESRPVRHLELVTLAGVLNTTVHWLVNGTKT
jgi:hypothetical protein